MTRRHLLALLASAAAGAVVDPERLLWVPGQKTFFLPSLVKPVLVGETVLVGKTIHVTYPPKWIIEVGDEVILEAIYVHNHSLHPREIQLTITGEAKAS